MRKSGLTCLVFATALEAGPFIAGLRLGRLPGTPFPAYRRGKLCAVLCGIGKANAAMAAAWACGFFKPRRLVNLGAAGALARGRKLGEVLQVTRVVEPDRPVLGSGLPHEHRPDVFEGFPGAVLSTMDRPALRPADRRALSRLAELADMEGAAVIQACRAFGAGCHLFKFVTDRPGNPSSRDIVRNIRKFRKDFFLFFVSGVLPRL